MVAPKHVRRSNEIKRLQRQLEELRELREKLAADKETEAQAKADKSPTDGMPTPLSSSSRPAVAPKSDARVDKFLVRKHDEQSRFLSLMNIDSQEYAPRILSIAGTVPGLTTNEFKAKKPLLLNKRPEKGNVIITSLPEGFDGEIMALPGSDVLHACRDPIVILADVGEISAVELPITEDENVALLVERNVTRETFNNKSFYAWDVQGQIKVGWVESEPDPSQAICVGRVVYGMVEIKPELRKTKSCWEEENETYS
ncbi:hypothetical protein BWQ96_02167 [Gracilariopsis chorda]|uniref:Rubisco accumulation factor 1 C-terminal domain-containing protein n=1 Tax=Gracilariopsis chorda TaxID=448386 RepID=A0A2V3J1L1_9FLOR|nr:hypothetical protein BWQ96_02167 [Gracilariopsis chorda]|eukprot:PXF48215.1 hypothetical protein BWQ96_02167 [Gracilariopsis chorda]